MAKLRPKDMTLKTLWQEAARAELEARLRGVTPDTVPVWGRMNTRQVIVHMADQLRMALGEFEVKPVRLWWAAPPIRQLVVYWLPWPEGAPTARELRNPAHGDWDRDLEELDTLLQRCVARGAGGPWAEHFAFGRLSGRAWGRLIYRHLDHHLRQLGA